MDAKLRAYLVELVGTFLVVLVGAGTACAARLSANPPVLDATGVALAEGLTYAVALTVAFYVSAGCLNPALTVMLWVFRRIENRQAAALIGVQLLGAALAGLLVRLTFATDVLREAQLGAPYLKTFLGPEGRSLDIGSLVSGTGVEFLLAVVVTLAVLASLFDPRAPRMGGVLAGLGQAAAILFAANLTAGSGNPARWFGTVVWERTLGAERTVPLTAQALVYAGGPVLGALAAAFLYHLLVLPQAKGRGAGS